MTEQVTEEYVQKNSEQVAEHLSALPVRIVKEPGERIDAAEFASWQSYVLAGGEQPFRLLAFDRKRSKATINVLTNGAGAQNVRLGRASQVQNGTGMLLATGGSITYSGQPEVWVAPVNAGAVIVSVEEERWK